MNQKRIELLKKIALLSEDYLHWLDLVAKGNLDITEMNSLHLCEQSLRRCLQVYKNPYSEFEGE